MTLIINLLLLVIIVAKCAYFWFARHLPAPIFKGACIAIQIATLVVDLLFVHSVGVFILDALDFRFILFRTINTYQRYILIQSSIWNINNVCEVLHMSDIFETVQANVIPIALSLIVIGVGINLLKGVFKLAILIGGCLLVANLAGII